MLHRRHQFKYPKLLALATIFIVSAIIFYEGKSWPPLHDFLSSIGYLGVFLGGFLYSYSFTAAPATAILLVLSENNNLFLAGLVAGIGALISDVIIFLVIRGTFVDEVRMLTREKAIKFIVKEEKLILGRLQKYLTTALASVLIASPLPTEIGVTLMASAKSISTKKFMAIAFLLHTLGIFTILLIGSGL